jgi:hypothetical protein
MKQAIALIATLFIFSGCEASGPWGGPAGTQMGITKKQVGEFAVLQEIGVAEQGFALYESKQAPKMVEGADKYQYMFTKSDELCMTQVSLPDIKSNNPPIAEDLRAKYGAPERDDSASWGVQWTPEKYKLDKNISKISIHFFGAKQRPDAVVSFEFTNYAECTP